MTCDYSNHSLILSMMAHCLKDDTSDPCFDGSRLSVIVFFNCRYYNCSKTIFCHCDNIDRPKSCNTIIAIYWIIAQLYCSPHPLPTLLFPTPLTYPTPHTLILPTVPHTPYLPYPPHSHIAITCYITGGHSGQTIQIFNLVAPFLSPPSNTINLSYACVQVP